MKTLIRFMVAGISCFLLHRTAKRFLVEWVLTPFTLVRRCKTQSIPFVSSKELLKDFKSGNTIVGNYWDLLTNIGSYDKVFFTRCGKAVMLIVADPTSIRQILVANADCYEKPLFIQSLSLIQDGIFSTSGNDWFHQRQLFEPHFIMKEIKKSLGLLMEVTSEHICSWENLQSSDMGIDIYQKFLQLTFILFGHFAFGRDMKRDMNDIILLFDEYLHTSRNSFFCYTSQLHCNWLMSGNLNKKLKEREDQLRNIVMTIFQKELACQDFASHEKRNLLSLLLNLFKSGELTEKQVIDNCQTFLLVGHETTASLLTWTVYLLAVHPHWQDKARDEATKLFTGESIQWSDVSRLSTINMILFESLRMFPPQPLVGRVCVKENKVGPFTIPRKLEVFIPVLSLHYASEFWGDDANEFRPERFAKGLNAASKNTLAFIPFGSGPRTCIGQVLALTEARLILASMLNRFSWTLSPSYHHCPDVTLTLHPSFGMPIILKSLTS